MSNMRIFQKIFFCEDSGDTNQRGDTPLMQAIINGHLDIAKNLISTLPVEQLGIQNYYGTNALMFAAAHGHKEIAESLISRMTSEQLQAKNRLGQTAAQIALLFK